MTTGTGRLTARVGDGPGNEADTLVLRAEPRLSRHTAPLHVPEPPGRGWPAERPLLTISPRHLGALLVPDPRIRRWQSWDFMREAKGPLPAPLHLSEIRKDRLEPMPDRGIGAWEPPTGPSATSESLPSPPAHLRPDPELDLAYADSQGVPALRIRLGRLSPGHVVLDVSSMTPANRLFLGYAAGPEETLLGFGMRTHPVPERGQLDLWVEEGPIGLGPLSGLFGFTGRIPLPKGPGTSCAAMPVWFSSLGYACWLDTPARVQVRLSPGERILRVWTPAVRWHVVTASDPLALMEGVTESLGRPGLIPPWALGPWHDSVRGEGEARRRMELLRRHRVPSSALWIEDFMGSRESRHYFRMRPLTHQVDETLYPDLPGLSRDLRALGMRLLGYACPEVSEGTDLYADAKAHRFLAEEPDGTPTRVSILGIHHGEFDLSQEAARRFVADRVLEPMAALGFDGWMADFGEYFPRSARTRDGETGEIEHNRYPVRWQALNRSFWQRRRPDGDALFFSRSAHLGSQRVAQILWGGDLDTDMEPADGLPCVVPQALSAAVSGLPFVSTDIGGYMTLGLTRPRSREVYLRWLELAALLPVMRTHHGMARPRNWQFDRDADTLRIHARYARLHTALFPYLYPLVQRATVKGHPIVRPRAFETPGDPTAWQDLSTFFVGPNLFVAPVLGRGDGRLLFLPPGKWREYFTGRLFTGDRFIRLAVPLDRLPLFVRHGSALPLFEGLFPDAGAGSPLTRHLAPEGIVDTLATHGQESLVTLAEADRAISLWLEGPGSSRLTLYDGTALEVTAERAGEIADRDVSTPAALVAIPATADHLPASPRIGRALRLRAGQQATVWVGSLRVRILISQSPVLRWYVLRPWGVDGNPGSGDSVAARGADHEEGAPSS